MSFKDLFDLKENPFRITPNVEPLWAGFEDLREKIKKVIDKSIKIPSSRLVINWGEYGSGKTHAAQYFCNQDVLKKSLDIDRALPFAVNIKLPGSRDVIEDLFVSVVDILDLEEIQSRFIHNSENKDESGMEDPEEHKKFLIDLEAFINDTFQNKFVASILKAIFLTKNPKSKKTEGRDLFSDKESSSGKEPGFKSNASLMKRFLYNSINRDDLSTLSEDYHIFRKLDRNDDYVDVLAGIFSCLTFQQRIYSSVMMWIDEFETISSLNNANTEAANRFVRDIMDSTPDHLLLFLNFTLSTFESKDYLGNYLSAAVRSRIRERVEFSFPDEDALKTYLKDLLNNRRFRDSQHEALFHPFDEEAVDNIIDILGGVSIRQYNDAFSMLLELAEYEEKKVITKEFVQEHEEEIRIWE